MNQELIEESFQQRNAKLQSEIQGHLRTIGDLNRELKGLKGVIGTQAQYREIQEALHQCKQELINSEITVRALEDKNDVYRRELDGYILSRKDADNLTQQIVHLSTYVKKVESHLHESQNNVEELRVLCAWCTVCKKRRATSTNGKRKFYCTKHKPKVKHDVTASKKAT